MLLAVSCSPHREHSPGANHATYTAETFFSTQRVFPARWNDGVFSHDERRILMESDRTGTFNAFALPVDGGNPEQLTHAVDGSVHPISWFPEDDRFIYEGDEGGDERTVIWVRELDGSSTAERDGLTLGGNLGPGLWVELGLVDEVNGTPVWVSQGSEDNVVRNLR